MRTFTVVIAVILAVIVVAPSAVAAEPNDDFVSATVISTLPFRAEQNTDTATTEDNEPEECGEVGTTLWYRWTAPTAMHVVADTRGSNFDTVLTVFQGTGPFDLQPVACNDNGLGRTSVVRFDAEPGATYYLQAGGAFSFASGDLVVNVSEPALLSGQVVDAITLDPLSDACVDVFDAALHRKVGETFTDLDGEYLLSDLPAIQIKVRFRDCAEYGPAFEGNQQLYKTQWYAGKKTFALATPIDLVGGTEVTNIDAALVPRVRPDVAITEVSIEEVPLSIGPAGTTPVETGTARRITVDVVNDGPISPRWTQVRAEVCPRSLGSCRSLGAQNVTLPPGATASAVFEWSATDMVGDVSVFIYADLNEDADWANNVEEVASFVHVGGTGVGVRVHRSSTCGMVPLGALITPDGCLPIP
jgi:hypothetical protein